VLSAAQTGATANRSVKTPVGFIEAIALGSIDRRRQLPAGSEYGFGCRAATRSRAARMRSSTRSTTCGALAAPNRVSESVQNLWCICEKRKRIGKVRNL
jgi:hypothetical protein